MGVLVVMKSLESRNFAKRTFTWQHRYYTITTEGCSYLRASLGITKENVNPKTHQIKPVEQYQGAREGGRQMTRGRGTRGGGRGFGDRGGFGGDRGGDRPMMTR